MNSFSVQQPLSRVEDGSTIALNMVSLEACLLSDRPDTEVRSSDNAGNENMVGLVADHGLF